MSDSPKRLRRRARSPHPGVVLLKPDPSGRHPHWRARFEDPDRRKVVKVRLDPLAYPTAETRRDWAKRKAAALAKRRAQIESGAPRATGARLEVVVERYFHAHSQLRARTVADYRAAATKLLDWARESGIATADDLTRPMLMEFKATLVGEPKRAPTQGRGQRGKRKPIAERRSAQTVNSELRRVRTVLAYLIELELLVRLSHDDLRRALKPVPTTYEKIEYLRPDELKKLLEAAWRHDADTFTATRDEHAGFGLPGSTTRYEPIAPFVAFVLLSGMRFSEALGLNWNQVRLPARPGNDVDAGEINLEGRFTKTRKARTIGLEVSPALRRLLTTMRLASGGRGSVFALTSHTAQAAAKRLRREYGAPPRFNWQALRRTCGTFLTNAPGIFGASSAYRSAQQLGHSVAIAERHYLGLERAIAREARTLEEAMRVDDLLSSITARVGEQKSTSASERGRRPDAAEDEASESDVDREPERRAKAR